MRSNTLTTLRRWSVPSVAQPARPRWFWALVCILGLAYALRLIGLVSESLWIDEGYSLALARYSVQEIVQGTVSDQHPPLYYLLLHAWLRVGCSLFQLRYLSVLIGTLGVAVGAWIGRELLGEDVGLGTGLLLASSPMHVWYSQEARMYVLLAVLVTLSAGLTWRLVRGRRGWVGYGVCTALALYTHYFSVFVILAENVFVLGWLLWRRTSPRRTGSQQAYRPFLWHWLGMQVLLALSFSPWLPVAVYQTRFHQMRWLAPPSAIQVAGTPLLMVLGDSGLGTAGVLVFVGLGLAVVWAVWRAWRAGCRDKLGGYAFTLGWLLVPFATIALLSVAYPLFQTKQMLMLLTPMTVLLAAALVRLPRVARVVLVGALAWFVADSLGMMYRVESKDGWREAGAYIQARYQPGDVLYMNPAAGILGLDAYLGQALPHDGYPPDYDVRTGGWVGELVTAAMAAREMAAVAEQYGRVWLIEFGPEFWDPEGYLRNELERNGQGTVEQRFGRIVVRLYELDRRSVAGDK